MRFRFPRQTRWVAAAIMLSSVLLPAYAQLTLGNLAKNTVIQRDSNSSAATFTLTGTCPSGTANIQMQLTWQDSNKVVPQFAFAQLTSTFTGTAFSATATGIPVGGPYIAQINAVDGGGTMLASVVDSSVLVGDVWLCEGQSNMQVAGSGSNPDSKHIHVRSLFYDGNPRAAHYTRNDTSHWATGTVNGPCMAFAGKIWQTSGVPIGIMYGSAGGSAFSAWDSSWFPSTRKFVSQACNWKIAGFLWYQGEAEDPGDSGLVYQAKFDSVLRDPIRSLSGNPRLPMVATQLESWSCTGTFAVNGARPAHWVIIRDRQELVGREDSATGTAPIWDGAGLHINSTDQGKLGPRAAARMLNTWLYSNRVPHQPAGPLFKQAWFQDPSRTKIVVQFKEVAGAIKNSADPKKLGFYVMKPNKYSNNDSLIFSNNDSMIVSVHSVDSLAADRVLITLDSAVADSITVGYGRTWNFDSTYNGNTIPPLQLTPFTDSSGIPLCTFFNRPILPQEPSAVKGEARSAPEPELMSLRGTLLAFNTAGKSPAIVSIFNINGRLVRKFSTMSRSVDLRKGLSYGFYTVNAKFQGSQISRKMLVN